MFRRRPGHRAAGPPELGEFARFAPDGRVQRVDSITRTVKP
ncbi:hypothetical protein [Microbispora sp. H10830]|nr:hypothetical protein [Microbispora sp. H10830]